jgi:hypothetical protein
MKTMEKQKGERLKQKTTTNLSSMGEEGEAENVITK